MRELIDTILAKCNGEITYDVIQNESLFKRIQENTHQVFLSNVCTNVYKFASPKRDVTEEQLDVPVVLNIIYQ